MAEETRREDEEKEEENGTGLKSNNPTQMNGEKPKFQILSNKSKRFQMHLSASECIPVGPSASEEIRTRSKTAKSFKNFETSHESFVFFSF